MKKVILTLVALCMAATAFAQFQIGGGYVLQTEFTKISGDNKTYTTPLNGFYVGISGNINLNDDFFSIAPGMYYSYTTGKDNLNIQGTTIVDGTEIRQALNIPFAFTFNTEVGEGDLFFSIVPTFVCGLVYSESYAVPGTTTIRVNNYAKNALNDNQSLAKRFDLKGGLLAGYQISHFLISVGYDFGILDQSRIKGITLRDNYFHAGLAFCF